MVQLQTCAVPDSHQYLVTYNRNGMSNWTGLGFDPTCHSLNPQPSEFLIYESSECLILPTDLQALEQPLGKQIRASV